MEDRLIGESNRFSTEQIMHRLCDARVSLGKAQVIADTSRRPIQSYEQAQRSESTERIKYSGTDLLSPKRDIMKYHNRIITEIRELPLRWKIVEEPKDDRSPAERYLNRVDQYLQEAQYRLPHAIKDDVVSLVFGSQAVSSDVASRHLANIIEERRTLLQRHVCDIKWRLDELLERKPFRRKGLGSYDDYTLTDVEKQILALELQKRELELALWRDTHELRTSLVTGRQEHVATQRRIGYLAGGLGGGA